MTKPSIGLQVVLRKNRLAVCKSCRASIASLALLRRIEASLVKVTKLCTRLSVATVHPVAYLLPGVLNLLPLNVER